MAGALTGRTESEQDDNRHSGVLASMVTRLCGALSTPCASVGVSVGIRTPNLLINSQVARGASTRSTCQALFGRGSARPERKDHACLSAIRLNASRFFWSLSGRVCKYFCVVWI